jgi:hypothetical protein
MILDPSGWKEGIIAGKLECGSLSIVIILETAQFNIKKSTCKY